MEELLGLLVIMLIIYIWYRNMTVREMAMMHSSRACKQQGPVSQPLPGSTPLFSTSISIRLFK
jgi:hypothetical protein